MRIELPSASWADTVQRADDDAHTLTVAGQTPSEWAPLELPGEADAPVHMEVQRAAAAALTLTF